MNGNRRKHPQQPYMGDQGVLMLVAASLMVVANYGRLDMADGVDPATFLTCGMYTCAFMALFEVAKKGSLTSTACMGEHVGGFLLTMLPPFLTTFVHTHNRSSMKGRQTEHHTDCLVNDERVFDMDVPEPCPMRRATAVNGPEEEIEERAKDTKEALEKVIEAMSQTISQLAKENKELKDYLSKCTPKHEFKSESKPKQSAVRGSKNVSERTLNDDVSNKILEGDVQEMANAVDYLANANMDCQQEIEQLEKTNEILTETLEEEFKTSQKLHDRQSLKSGQSQHSKDIPSRVNSQQKSKPGQGEPSVNDYESMI